MRPSELRERRMALGLSQTELGRALGVTRNTVARWERGELSLGSPGLVRLALERLETVTGQQAQAEAREAPHARPRRNPRVLGLARGALVGNGCGGVQQGDSGIPQMLTSFVGREQELIHVSQLLLRGQRLVVLTGAGGVGKTRLALRAATEVEPHFADGVTFVPLASIKDPPLVGSTIAQRVCAAEGTVPTLARLDHVLRDKHQLLVLDNFEQVRAAAPLVVELLQACPRLHVLVTSRGSLHVSGEYDYLVPPLPLPAREPTAQWRDCPSVRLFTERAQAVATDLSLTEEDGDFVSEICRRLDGLPLAIELAAARVQVMSPRTIVAHLGGWLDLLVDGPQDVDGRHQTLRAAITWSYDLLDPAEQALFRQLAVFAGGWTLEAAAALSAGAEDSPPGRGRTAGILSQLSSLVGQGLIQATRPPGGEPRFAFLETVREYALEQLVGAGDAEATHATHARYFLALARRLGNEQQTHGPQERVSLDELEREHDNLRAALRWALDVGGAEAAIELARALRSFWYLRGHFDEALRGLQEVLALPAEHRCDARRVELLNAAASVANRLGKYSEANRFSTDALVLARELDDRLGMTHALTFLGQNAEHQGKYADAHRFLEESVDLSRMLGLPIRIAASVHNLLWLECQETEYATALARAEETFAIGRRLSSAYVTGVALKDIGYAAMGQGDYAHARAALSDALTLGAETGSLWLASTVLEGLGQVGVRTGDYPESELRFAESLQICRRMGELRGIYRCLEGFASLAAARGQGERALQLAGAAAALREKLGAPPSPREQQLLHPGLARSRKVLGQHRAGQAWSHGHAVALDDAIALALGAATAADRCQSPTDQPALTRREAEVLRLLAGGKSNRHIAATLVLSVRTVERHVANVYAKIHVRSRAEATAFALRRGIA